MMKKSYLFICLLLLTSGTASASESIPAFMGDWRGAWVNTQEGYHQKSPQLTAQVVGLGHDRYRVIFREEFQRRADIIFQGEGILSEGVVHIKEDEFHCRITGHAITGAGIYKSEKPVSFALKPFSHVSPTMGRPPPDGAVVLFDGSSLEKWHHLDTATGSSRKATWRIVDGVMEILPGKLDKSAGGNLHTRRLFKSCELHIEFFLPYEPENRGQGRANSGVFLQNAYEVQILDSFGLIGDWTECGALYKVSPPKVNRAAPPGQWQTYDITFHAPEFDEEGKLVRNAVMTVLHNGRLIHLQEKLPERTSHTTAIRLEAPPHEAASIRLQDHGHPIRFRNIWAVELD
jgi:hypothetical protein